ncbi:MAG: DNA polymerase III subunit chi, partial [Pseudomonadota bacterium]
MTRVDFYILKDTAPEARELFAARLVEKAYRLGHKVFVHTANMHLATLFDEYLWTFRDGSFVPHCIEGSEEERFAPVHV